MPKKDDVERVPHLWVIVSSFGVLAFACSYAFVETWESWCNKRETRCNNSEMEYYRDKDEKAAAERIVEAIALSKFVAVLAAVELFWTKIMSANARRGLFALPGDFLDFFGLWHEFPKYHAGPVSLSDLLMEKAEKEANSKS